MELNGWRYYNHALVPTCAPHETPNLEALNDKSIWKTTKALFAQWTEDYDCQKETGWYYIVKEGPFDENELSSSTKKHIRQAFKKVYVEKINVEDYAQELAEVFNSACSKYEDWDRGLITPSAFKSISNRECWGAFSVESKKLVGYMECRLRTVSIDTITAKYHSDYLNLRASDALHYHILQYYLNEQKYHYICSGSKNINHKTNVQSYKIDTFNFRKANCKLCIKYNPKVKWLIKILYPFRGLLRKLDGIGLVHKINGVLKLENIVRKQGKV